MCREARAFLRTIGPAQLLIFTKKNVKMATGKTGYWTSDRIMHLIIGVVSGVLLILLVRYLSRVVLPFFVALFIVFF